MQSPHNSSILDDGGVRKEGKKGRKYILDENMESGFQAFIPITILFRKLKKKSTIIVTLTK